MNIPGVESAKNLFSGSKVPHVRLEGLKTVTSFSFLGTLKKDSNTLVNEFDLNGYELRSDSVEFKQQDGTSLGMGYICDQSGITVDIKRAEKKIEPVQEGPAEIPEEDVSISGTGTDAPKPDLESKKSIEVPYVLLKGKDRINVIEFGYIRKIENALIDDMKKKRFEIKTDPIEITGYDKKKGMGFVLDESGKTISIYRNIIILKKDKDGKDIETGIQYSGDIGKLLSTDFVAKFFDFGQSGRAKWIFGLTMFLVGQMLMLVFHI